jgi:CRP-like cAMP-binding protein
VLDGVQHLYFSDEKNRTATVVFMYSPSFAGVLDSLLLQQRSRYTFETLTPSAFLRLPAKRLHELIESRPVIARMIQKGVTEALSGVMKRLAELQCFPAEDRFRSLLMRSPHLLNLVPRKYLASYIGVDPTNFSKMMNKIRI